MPQRARCVPVIVALTACAGLPGVPVTSRTRPHASRDRPSRSLRGVQVDERGPGAGVAHPLHQLAQARACRGRHRVSGMAQIVKMQLREARPHRRPGSRTCGSSTGAAARPWGRRRRARRRRPPRSTPCASSVPARSPWETRRFACPPGTSGLWPISASLAQLRDGYHHADLACVQVDVVAPESGELAQTQVGEGGEQDQRPVSTGRLGDREHSGRVHDMTRSSEYSWPAPLIWHGLRRRSGHLLPPSS